MAAVIHILPIGSVEAHGPHLPPDTDTLIVQDLARRFAAALSRSGLEADLAPTFVETASSFARDHPSTRHVPGPQETQGLLDAVAGLAEAGAERVVLVTLHFDPEHLAAVRQVLARSRRDRVVFVDFTRRAHAQRIGGEFATGSCHGGQFETSLMLAAAPGRVDAAYKHLPDVFVDLPAAIRAGHGTFAAAGMPDAYCGSPARASAAEGERLFSVLTQILVDTVAEPAATSGS